MKKASKKNQDGDENIKYLKIFVLVVFIAAAFSVSYKIYLAIVQSSFKYDTFNLLIKGRQDSLIRINKAQKKILIIHFPQTNLGKSKLTESFEVGVPIDGQITYKSDDDSELDHDFLDKSTLQKLLFGSLGKENINDVDLLKIYFLTKQISGSDRSIENEVSLDDVQKKLSNSFLDFSDQKIFNEKKSVQIINATEINGAGGELATVLRALGYNVISVENGESRSSKISSSEESISIKRLKDFLAFPYEKSPSAIADITIVLGKDLANQLTN